MCETSHAWQLSYPPHHTHTHTQEATQEDTGHREEEEDLLAVREMMDLTARDLLESQLLEEATVPSVSPLAMSHPRRYA